MVCNRMKFSTRDIFGIFLVLLTGLASLGAWREFFIVGISDDTSIGLIFVWFSILAAFFFVGAVVWTNTLLRWLGALFLFLPSLVFLYSWAHLLCSAIGVLFAFLATRLIAHETGERVRFHFFRSARAGQFVMVFALALTLSSGFFTFVKDASWEKIIPKLRIGEGTATVVVRVASYLYPELKDTLSEEITVDQFLLDARSESDKKTMKENDISKEETNLLFSLPMVADYLNKNGYDDMFRGTETAETLYLRSGRSQLSTLAGRTVLGDEKIADIFALAASRRITTFLGEGDGLSRLPPKTLPFILSILFFLTLLSLGSLVGPLWILFATGIFYMAILFRFIRIVRRQKEQEILED